MEPKELANSKSRSFLAFENNLWHNYIKSVMSIQTNRN